MGWLVWKISYQFPSFASSGFSVENLITFVQSYGILLLIIVLSVIFASGLILIKTKKNIITIS